VRQSKNLYQKSLIPDGKLFPLDRNIFL
jgi:hypothetical protein